MKYKHKRDNFLFSIFEELKTVGQFSMPVIEPVKEVNVLNLLTFNYWKTCPNPDIYHLCFYIDDYQFERLWNEPLKSWAVLKNFRGIIGPDFSMYRDFPLIL